MAAKRSPAQLRELSAFIEALFAEGGYSTWAEFADDARVHRVSISNWKNGTAGIDGVNLFRLIRAAAARAAVKPEALAVGLAPRPGMGAEDTTILARLDELAGSVTEALELLRAVQPSVRGGQRTQGSSP